jgi:hypothetical protein
MGGLVNDASESIWMELIVAYLRYCPGIYLEVLKKNFRISGILAKI